MLNKCFLLVLDNVQWESVRGRISVILLSWASAEKKKSYSGDAADERRVKIDWIAMRQLSSRLEPCMSQSGGCFSSRGPLAAPQGLGGNNFTQSNPSPARSDRPRSCFFRIRRKWDKILAHGGGRVGGGGGASAQRSSPPPIFCLDFGHFDDADLIWINLALTRPPPLARQRAEMCGGWLWKHLRGGAPLHD